MNAPTEKLVILGEVTVRSIASSEDPYGTGGFSSLSAHVLAADAAGAAALKKSFAAKALVTVRCGALEVDGRVERYDEKMPGVAAVAVSDVRVAKAR